MEKEQKFESPKNAETYKLPVKVSNEYPKEVSTEPYSPTEAALRTIVSMTRDNNEWGQRAFKIWKKSLLDGKSLSPVECVNLAREEIAREKGDTEFIK